MSQRIVDEQEQTTGGVRTDSSRRLRAYNAATQPKALSDQLFDPRTRLVALFLLTLSHAYANTIGVMTLGIFSIILALLLPNATKRGLFVIVLTGIALAVFGVVVSLVGTTISPAEIAMGIGRLLSLTVTTVVLALSFTILDFISGLIFFRIPFRVALAVAVGLRFLPVITDEMRRTAIVRRHRGLGLSWSMLREFGFFGAFIRIASPVIVSVLRRVDSLVLSVHTQQLESRLKNRQMKKLRIGDWLMLFVVIVISLWVLVDRYVI